ncbi:23 kDa integral membrane protein-like [Stomoxys calcitrans]|uniref:Tetraspanin n=1 Tax=Stomoxys calcitrans TaxID=35570 RepID=A0A1I8PDT4_STOCA|nr:23 kDa integral membrane protein-like [Stomoxys calcitrans]
MDCGTRLIKYLLFIFNIFCVICGLLLIIMGSILLKELEKSSNIFSMPVVIILVGCITFVVAFFGCCGVVRGSGWCTSIYVFGMITVLFLQIGLIACLFVQEDQIIRTVEESVTHIWEKKSLDNGYAINSFQIAVQCCGLNSYLDYTYNNVTVPSSCCGSMTGECDANIYKFKRGCRSKIMDILHSNINNIRYSCIGMALVEHVAIILACYFKKGIRTSDNTYIYGTR